MTSELLLITNSVICGAIAARVFAFNRDGATHRRWGGWIAYFLIVASASIPLRALYAIVTSHVMTADPSEVVINALVLAALLKTRGNVVQIFKVKRS